MSTTHHLCHATVCRKPVVPSLGFCTHHWKMLPRDLRKQWSGATTPSRVIATMVENIEKRECGS